MTTIGIDNGVSGSVGILGLLSPAFFATPTKDALHYSKKGNMHQRIDVPELVLALAPFAKDARAFIERPFTAGPMFINTMLLAARAFEATLIALEQLGIGYEVVDSRTWQKAMLPGVKTSAALKMASRLRGIQLWPQLKDLIEDHGDADSLLMAKFFSESHVAV